MVRPWGSVCRRPNPAGLSVFLRVLGLRAPRPRFFSLAALLQNALPDAVDGLLELGFGCGSNLVQVRLWRRAPPPAGFVRPPAPHRCACPEPCGLAGLSHP